MLTKEQAEQYECAAVALESGDPLPAPQSAEWAAIAWKAWEMSNVDNPEMSMHDVDEMAARLLRECVAAGRTL